MDYDQDKQSQAHGAKWTLSCTLRAQSIYSNDVISLVVGRGFCNKSPMQANNACSVFPWDPHHGATVEMPAPVRLWASRVSHGRECGSVFTEVRTKRRHS